MSNFGAGFRETLHQVASDRSAKSALVGAIVLYSFFYPAPYRPQVATRQPVAVIDLDRSPMSRGLVRNTLAVQALDVVELGSSFTAARTSLERARVEAIMVIQPDFQRDILRGRQGEVALFGNGAVLAHGSAALGGFSDALGGFARDAAVVQARFAGAGPGPPLSIVRRPLFNTREGYGSAIVPAVAILIVQQTLLLGIGLVMGTSQARHGRLTMRAPRVLGMSSAFGVFGMTSLLYFAGFVFWFQDYPRAGDMTGLGVATLLFVGAVVGLGMFLASFFHTRERPVQLIVLLSLPMFFLAGVSWPVSAFPTPLIWLAKLLPSTAGITAMVKFNQMGARVGEAADELWNLALLVLLYGGLAIWRYQSRRTTHGRALATSDASRAFR
jgi:ABC-2 type transport system permease protein